jgi:hypothetical protein
LIEKYPKSNQMPEALYALAWAEIDQKQFDAARPVFVRLAKDYPTHPLAADASFRRVASGASLRISTSALENSVMQQAPRRGMRAGRSHVVLKRREPAGDATSCVAVELQVRMHSAALSVR